MDTKIQTYCAAGRQKSNTFDIIEHKKRNPKTNKSVEVRKGKCDNCGRPKPQTFTK